MENKTVDKPEMVIDGVVTVTKDINEDVFTDLFIDWIESNGFSFGGTIHLYRDEPHASLQCAEQQKLIEKLRRNLGHFMGWIAKEHPEDMLRLIDEMT